MELGSCSLTYSLYGEEKEKFMRLESQSGSLSLAQSEVREVLQYVPRFAGKIFIVALSGGRMPDTVLAETLLDLITLQRIGVKLVVFYAGGSAGDFLDRAVEVELRLSETDSEKCVEVLCRGQAALITVEGELCFHEELVGLAEGVKADKILYVGREEVLPELWREKRALSLEDARGGLSTVREGDLSWWCMEAVSRGVKRVHFLDAQMPGCLSRELFSNEGVGVMIYAGLYQEVRALSEEDIPELLAIIGRSIRLQHLLPRSYEEIASQIQDYYVMTIDGNVVGSVALYPYEEGVCELACLFVKDTHKGLGYGHALVHFAERRAAECGFREIFALTTDAGGFFEKQMGYEPIALERLPKERYEKLLRSGRASIALIKGLKGGR